MSDIFSTMNSTIKSATASLAPMTGGGKKRKVVKRKAASSPASSCEWHSTGRKAKLPNGEVKTVWTNDKREKRVRKMVHRNGKLVASYVKY